MKCHSTRQMKHLNALCTMKTNEYAEFQSLNIIREEVNSTCSGFQSPSTANDSNTSAPHSMRISIGSLDASACNAAVNTE